MKREKNAMRGEKLTHKIFFLLFSRFSVRKKFSSIQLTTMWMDREEKKEEKRKKKPILAVSHLSQYWMKVG